MVSRESVATPSALGDRPPIPTSKRPGSRLEETHTHFSFWSIPSPHRSLQVRHDKWEPLNWCGVHRVVPDPLAPVPVRRPDLGDPCYPSLTKDPRRSELLVLYSTGLPVLQVHADEGPRTLTGTGEGRYRAEDGVVRVSGKDGPRPDLLERTPRVFDFVQRLG